WRRRGEKQSAACKLGAAVAIGEEAVMADAVEAVPQRMQEEGGEGTAGGGGNHLGLVAVPIAPPAEADLPLFEADEPTVGDGDAMGVAAEIGEDLLRTAEGGRGVDAPFDPTQLPETLLEGALLGQPGEIAEEAEIAGIECGLESLQEQP